MGSSFKDHYPGFFAGALLGLVSAGLGALGHVGGLGCALLGIGTAIVVSGASFVWVALQADRLVAEAEDRIQKRSARIPELFEKKDYGAVLNLANEIRRDQRITDSNVSRRIEALIDKSERIVRGREEAQRKELNRQREADLEQRVLREHARAQEERRQVEEAQRAAQLEREEEENREREHVAQLTGFRCRLAGGCWVSLSSGSSEVVRGLTIGLYPATAQIAADLQQFFLGVRFAEDVAAQLTSLRRKIEPHVLKSAHTDIDGRYSLGEVAGGRYVLFAAWAGVTTSAYWLKLLDIDCNGARRLDLHTENATETLSASE